MSKYIDKIRVLLLSLMALVTYFTFAPLPVYASNTTQATYTGTIVITNNDTATLNVSVNCVINSSGLINAHYANSALNNTAIQYAGADIAYMPAPGSTDDWMIFIPSIGADTVQNDTLFTGGLQGMEAKIRYFPGVAGMTVDDDASLEFSTVTFEVKLAGFFDASVSDNMSMKSGAFSIISDGSGSINATTYSAASQKSVVASSIATGEHAFRILNNNSVFAIYVDDILEDSTPIDTVQLAANQIATNANYSEVYTNKRLSFYAQGLFWFVDVDDGSNRFYLYTSADGSTWTGPTEYSDGIASGIYSVVSDGDNIHYVSVSGAALMYRMGTLNTTGAITWAGVEQTIMTVLGGTPSGPRIALDSNGYPCVVFCYNAVSDDMRSYRSTTKDGTWTNDTDYYKSFQTITGAADICKMDDGEIGIVFSKTGFSVKANVYNPDTGWAAVGYETASTALGNGAGPHCISVDDDLYLFFTEQTSNNLTCVIRDGSTDTWGSEIIVQASAANYSAIQASYDSLLNVIIAFWAESPDADKIYYKKYDISTTTWDTDPTEFVDETAASMIGWSMSCAQENISNHIMLNYITGGGPTYYIKATGFIPSGVNMTDNANDWVFFENDVMPYMEYSKIWVNDTLQSHIAWANNSSAFIDLSGNSNDATPSFRTTSTDADVTAYLASFTPVSESKASGWTIVDDPTMLTGAPGTIDNLYSELNNTENIPMGTLVNEMLDEGEVPRALFWFPLIFGIASLGGLALYKQMKSLLMQAIVIGCIIGLFAAIGPAPFWTVLLFIPQALAIMVSQKAYGW